MRTPAGSANNFDFKNHWMVKWTDETLFIFTLQNENIKNGQLN